MADLQIILVGDPAQEVCPSPAIGDIWPKARDVLRHYGWMNQEEDRVRELQYAILRDGAFLSPSIFRVDADACTSSFHFRHRVFYRFHNGEEYFWITSLLDRCYGLSALYLPERNILLALYPYIADVTLIEHFELMRSRIGCERVGKSDTPTAPVIVAGFHHMMHTLWNELPALDRAIAAGLAPAMRVIATHEPMGPLIELFPELRGRVETVTMAEMDRINRSTAMLTTLGAWSISDFTQDRVISVAKKHTSAATCARIDEFKRTFSPIFWLSVKPPKRTVEDQPTALSAIISGLRDKYPRAGFLLNGVSYPFDYVTNSNYEPWFRDMMSKASLATQEIIGDILELLTPELNRRVVVISDVTVCEEISWTAIADFYFCHGGSMQNKIGWVRKIPGVIHSNSSFIASFKNAKQFLETPAMVATIAQDLIVDDDAANYNQLELDRKDQNYRFRSSDLIIDEILTIFQQSGWIGKPLNTDKVATEHTIMQRLVPHARDAIMKLRTLSPNRKQMADPTERSTAAISIPDLAGEDYGTVLNRLHKVLRPKTYLEVGVYAGGTLALADCSILAVDPDFNIRDEHIIRKILSNSAAQFFKLPSDDFFSKYNAESLLGAKVDMAFLDGMHRCEFLLRDFINTERVCKRNSVVILHDCLPVEADMTGRVIGQQSANPARAGMWTGDVWRTALLLKRKRPDLSMTVLDARPTGLVLISNLDPSSTDLATNYDAFTREMLGWDLSQIGLGALFSELNVEPTSSMTAHEAITARFWL